MLCSKGLLDATTYVRCSEGTVKRMNKNGILHILFMVLLSYRYCDSSGEANNQQQCYSVGNEEICYFQGSKQTSNWSSAYQICQAKDATLPVIRNADYQYALEKYLNYLQSRSADISFIWTSGKREVLKDWTWVNGQSISDKSRQHLLARNTSESYETHVAIQYDTSLIRSDPDFRIPFFCQYFGRECTYGRSARLADSCIFTHDYMETWFDARDDCLFRGGDLAVLTDSDQELLRNLTQGQLSHYRFWIGLTKISWFWMIDIEKSLKEEVKYSKWSRYSWIIWGDECIRIEAFNGKWMKSDCGGWLSVICQRKATSPSNCPMVFGQQQQQQQFGVQNSGTIVLMLVFGIVLGIAVIVIAALIVRRRRPSTWARLEEMDRT